MIRVLHCISDTNFGGAGRVLLNYLNHFDSAKFEVSVVLPKGSKLLAYMDADAYQIIELDGLYDRSFNAADVKALKKVIRTLRPDIVHSHGALSARIAGKQCGCKVVYTRHSVFDLPAWQTSFLGRTALGTINSHYADRIIAVSPAAKTLLTDSGTPEDKIDVIFNGVEAVERQDVENCIQIREQYGIGKDAFVCSIIARLEEVKGHKYVIDAARLLKDQGESDVRVLIAGTGGIEEELKAYAAEQDVTDMVCFVGFIKEIGRLLSVTDLQLNASYGTEATSMALLEGFSLGIPAVVSDFGGNPYVVSHEENGLIFRKKDAHTLAKAILRMKNDKELYAKTSVGAGDSFKKRFTAETMAAEMEEVYSDLIQRSK